MVNLAVVARMADGRELAIRADIAAPQRQEDGSSLCRVSVAPLPRTIFPSSSWSPPRTSVARVTSIAIATSGSVENAAVREPAKSPTSSWTAATAITSPGAPPCPATLRAASRAT